MQKSGGLHGDAPLPYSVFFSGKLIHDQQCQGKHHKYRSTNLGDQRQLGFYGLGLVLAEIAIQLAGNGTQTTNIALLQQHRPQS